jgi:hypothetical protein
VVEAFEAADVADLGVRNHHSLEPGRRLGPVPIGRCLRGIWHL